uniref:Site-2 protease family protein n=1 Tax=Archaeoglobus fulgidus TaxID=2234 RepID=A0A7J2TIB2_ARCFL
MRIEDYFYIYGIEKGRDFVRYLVIPRRSDEEIAALLAELSAEYDASLKWRYGELILELKRKKMKAWINLVLLIATFFSTSFFGSLLYGEPDIFGGLLFSVAILFILGSHELAHYAFARRWKMRTSLPYFIPFPTIIGTLGAIIKHSGVIPSRRALVEVGASGPIVGFLASLIVTYIGLGIPFNPQFERGEGIIMLGTSIAFELMVRISGFSGEFLHPIAFAGWVGILLTFFNLLPIGQLDGGHVARALIGEKSEIVSKTFPIFLIIMGLFFGEIWIFWGIILVFFSAIKHPKPINDERLDLKGFLLGISCYIIAILCFTPRPFIFELQ